MTSSLRANLGRRGPVVAAAWAVAAAAAFPALAMFARLPAHAEAFAVLSHPARLGGLAFRTAAASLGAVLVAVAVGAPLGFLFFRTDLPGRRVFVFGAVLTACLPLYVVLTCWMALGGLPLWTGSLIGAAWIMGVAWAPLVTLITGAACAAADRSLEDQALVDTNAWGVFRHVLATGAAWAVAASAGAVLFLALSNATVTDILGVRALADEAMVQFQLSGEPWRATALALPAFAALLALAALLMRALRRFGRASGDEDRRPRALPLGRARWPLMLLASAVGLAYLTPFGALVQAAGGLGEVLGGFRRMGRELAFTLGVTAASATVATAAAAWVAWALVRVPTARRMGAGLLALAAAAPASVTGVGLVHLFNRPGPLGLIYDSSAILVIAQAIRALPFAVLALVPAFRRVPLDLEEAAALDGCGPLRRLCHVALPMCLHGLAVAWFLAFVLSLGEVGASVLVTPPGEATLAIHFYTQVHAGVYPTTAAMCLALLALAGVPAAAFTALVAPRLEGAPRSLIGPAAAPRSPATP